MAKFVFVSFSIFLVLGNCSGKPLFPYKLGDFSEYFHKVDGELWAIDQDTIEFRNFFYDGNGPDTFFILGNKESEDEPNLKDGIPLAYFDEGKETKEFSIDDPDIPILRMFLGETFLIKLPQGLRVTDLKWISVYCREFDINFGDIIFAEKPLKEKVEIQDKVEEPKAEEDSEGEAEAEEDSEGDDAKAEEDSEDEAEAEEGSEAEAESGDAQNVYGEDEPEEDNGYPRKIGDISKLSRHPLSGELWALNDNTLEFKKFVYDGEAPDAFFIIGLKNSFTGPEPNLADAIPVPFYNKNAIPIQKAYSILDKDLPVLGEFKGQTLRIALPPGIKVDNSKWLSVYCRKFDTDFGHVKF